MAFGRERKRKKLGRSGEAFLWGELRESSLFAEQENEKKQNHLAIAAAAILLFSETFVSHRSLSCSVKIGEKSREILQKQNDN